MSGILFQPVTDEETKLLREKIIESRRKTYTITEGEVSKRWNFEEAVSCCTLIINSWNINFAKSFNR